MTSISSSRHPPSSSPLLWPRTSSTQVSLGDSNETEPSACKKRDTEKYVHPKTECRPKISSDRPTAIHLAVDPRRHIITVAKTRGLMTKLAIYTMQGLRCCLLDPSRYYGQSTTRTYTRSAQGQRSESTLFDCCTPQLPGTFGSTRC